MKNVFREHLEVGIKFFEKYKILIIGGVGLCIILGGGFFLYKWRSGNIEQKAQLAFVESLNYFNAKVKSPDLKTDQLSIDDIELFATNEEKWSRVVDVFEKAFGEHSSSSLAPLFIAIKSEGLIHLGKLDEAISSLEKVVGDIKNDDVQDLYQVKLGMMQLDSSSGDVHNVGVERLRKVAEKSNSAANDLALYRLGEYYWTKNDFTSAKNYWNQLTLRFGSKTKDPSEWANLASDKLKLIEEKV